MNSKKLGSSVRSNNGCFLFLLGFFVIFWFFWMNPYFRETEKPSVEIVERKEINKNEAALEIASEDKEEFRVGETGFWIGLGATKGHMFDTHLAAGIIEYFKQENVTSVLELGAGTGLYAKEIKANGIFLSCYDGNPNTQVLSDGRCGVIDLSKPIELCRHEWVLSLEVGEHIPKQFEDIFISNLVSGDMKGIILSWAVEGQGGTSHVNTRNNTYIRVKMHAKGYSSDFKSEAFLRGKSSFSWFKNTIMVFRKED